MNSRTHLYPSNPYDYNIKTASYQHFPEVIRSGSQLGIKYQDDSLSPIESDDDDNYLQKDKHGKIMNLFQRTNNNTKSSIATNNATEVQTATQVKKEESDDTKERLTRLEIMLEKLIKRETDMSVKKANKDQTLSLDKTKSDVEFSLEPKNHHFTTSMWLNKIQEIAITNNYSEKQTIQLMERHMTGLIKTWYKTLPEKYNFTWPELKLLVVKIFPDNYDFIITLKRLVTRIKQTNESMQTYFYSKMYLIEACKITGGEDAVSCLIDGLNNQQIQIEAKQQNYLTPETLFTQYLSRLPDYAVDYTPIETETTEWYSDTVQQPTLPQQQFKPTVEYLKNVTSFKQPIFEVPVEVVQQQFPKQQERPSVHARLGNNHFKKRRKMPNRKPDNKLF